MMMYLHSSGHCVAAALMISLMTEETLPTSKAWAVLPADNNIAAHATAIPATTVLRIEPVAERGIFDSDSSSIEAR